MYLRMSLEKRIKKIEEQIGGKEEERLLVIITLDGPLHSEKEEGLEELPENEKEWITFNEQMQQPNNNNPHSCIRLFIKDPLKELEARRLAKCFKVVNKS